MNMKIQLMYSPFIRAVGYFLFFSSLELMQERHVPIPHRILEPIGYNILKSVTSYYICI